MKKESKKEQLIEAILSKDKDKLKEALQKGKPDKWITVVLDHCKQTIEYQKRLITKEEFEAIIKQEEKDHCVKLVVMNFNRDKEGCIEEDWDFPTKPEINMEYRKVTMNLNGNG